MDLEKGLGEMKEYMEPMPPVGIAYIAAVLREKGVDVSVMDAFARASSREEIGNKIREEEPDVVGISCLTPSANGVYKICKEIKNIDENIFVVLGNRHAEVFAKETIRKGIADAVVKGEGEYTMLKLVKKLENDGNLSDIDGIVFKNEGELIDTGPGKPVKNLDELSYPAWDLLPYYKYGVLPIGNMEKPMLGILSTRGCMYNCSFCSGRKLEPRERSPESVVDEIEFLIEEYNAKQITFMDLMFPATRKHGLELCQEMIDRGVNDKIVWITETRVDLADKELLRKMKEAGCRRVMFGMESGSQRILNKIRKGIKLEKAEEAVANAQKVGLETVGFFMIGLPGETRKEIEKTIDFAKKSDLDFVKFAVFRPFPGSEIYSNLVDEGKINFEDIEEEDWVGFSPHNPEAEDLVWAPEDVGKKELVELKWKAHRDFYLYPQNIFNLLFKVRTIPLGQVFNGAKTILTEYLKGVYNRIGNSNLFR